LVECITLPGLVGGGCNPICNRKTEIVTLAAILRLQEKKICQCWYDEIDALALLFYILSYSISATFRNLQVEIRSQLVSREVCPKCPKRNSIVSVYCGSVKIFKGQLGIKKEF
jgi:hypothetical protein